MGKFLKENWFKFLIVIGLFLIVFIYWDYQRISVIKYCRDSAYKNEAFYRSIEEGIETCLNTIKKYK